MKSKRERFGDALELTAWGFIAGVTFMFLVVATTHAQDRTIITAGLTNDMHAEGVYTDEVATRKPAGVNQVRIVMDRKEHTDPNVRVTVALLYSLDEGKTFVQHASASTKGGVLRNAAGEVLTASSVRVDAPPEGSLLATRTTITGGSARTGTVLQMWEVR
jgi:hypothetical protein